MIGLTADYYCVCRLRGNKTGVMFSLAVVA